MKPLKRSARRSLLVAHVAVSVGRLGLTVGLLALTITAFFTADPAMARAAARAMKVSGDWLIVPVALFSLFSGLVLALGTPWGPARHRWVWTKFWLTLITTVLSVFSLRPGIDEAAARHRRCRPGDRSAGGNGDLPLHHRDTGAEALGPGLAARPPAAPPGRAAKEVDARTQRRTA